MHRDGEEGGDLGKEDEVEVGLEEADVTMLEALKDFLLWLVTFASLVSDIGDMKRTMVSVRCVYGNGF